jgi:hypothetical protein
MARGKDTEKLYEEARELLEKFGETTDMTHVEAIGVLQMLCVHLAEEARKIIEAERDEGDKLDAGIPDGM